MQTKQSIIQNNFWSFIIKLLLDLLFDYHICDEVTSVYIKDRFCNLVKNSIKNK